MEGYLRKDGRKGIRNVILVAYLVECAHFVASEIAYPYKRDGVQIIGFGGCYPEFACPQGYESTMYTSKCWGCAANFLRL